MKTIQVLLADDHAVVRMGFRLLLETTDDIRVVAEASSGEEACRIIAAQQPDVVVMDVSMPGIGGIQATKRLIERHPNLRILMLSAHMDSVHPRLALKAGARGYMTKRSAAEALVSAIRQVAQGCIYLEPNIAHELALQQINGANDPVEMLTLREFEVFKQLASGRSVRQVADSFFLSQSTVGTHLYNIKQKLGAGNSAELAMFAVRSGIVDIGAVNPIPG
ncbi:response regulator [Aromatoleum diolicum]|uniref:Response regulator n=1 Tax=Aromatoleum diolicum TaxID=75796 RepID=A0ABX1Q9V1_9RHOO|nr:response regulator transcription factor [Aromatoleum diolicum]NMG74206.1 response regulator [Aromatoleum diolicum]